MRIVIEGVDSLADLGLHFDEDGEPIAGGLSEAISEQLALALIARISEKEVDRLLRAGIRKAVGNIINKALNGRPMDIPQTLLGVIAEEARQQIRKGDSYQGVSTPLKHVVAAEVYRVLHDEVEGLIEEARKNIREQIPAEIARIARRSFGTRQL